MLKKGAKIFYPVNFLATYLNQYYRYKFVRNFQLLSRAVTFIIPYQPRAYSQNTQSPRLPGHRLHRVGSETNQGFVQLLLIGQNSRQNLGHFSFELNLITDDGKSKRTVFLEQQTQMHNFSSQNILDGKRQGPLHKIENPIYITRNKSQ